MRADSQEQAEYRRLRRQLQPRLPLARNAIQAFLVGGAICAVGQVFFDLLGRQGLPVEQAGAYTSVVVAFAGAVATGFGIYDELVKFGGMGGSLPISGFANAVVAPAMEYRREGWVLGVGARMFTVAGPVIVYGVLTSFVVGAARVLLHRV